MVSKNKIGTTPDGLDQFNYDFSDHPGMQDPDITKHTHVLVKTPIPLNGSVTLDSGNAYDLSEDWLAVPVEDIDALAIKVHTVAKAAGLTPDPVPTVGPVQQARDAFIAAGWQPPAGS
jgi:hypothetical protein